jgi:hypothetical protein
MTKIKTMVSLFIVLSVLVIPSIAQGIVSGVVYTMTNDTAGNHVGSGTMKAFLALCSSL